MKKKNKKLIIDENWKQPLTVKTQGELRGGALPDHRDSPTSDYGTLDFSCDTSAGNTCN